ncbi:MAG TPA: CapA family protein [Pyrinomonadaceae bacterium]|jgi:poly-gamma-glutamate capsule biosynthesis protein CapA/YwtB (metallophosphatase superfamily)
MLKPLNFLLILALTAGFLTSLSCTPNTVSSEERSASSSPLPTPTPAKTTDGDALTIAAVGDIMLGSTSINDTFLPPNDGADILKEVTPILSAADIAFGNLEGPMLEGGKTEKCPPGSTRCFAFRVPTRYGKLLKNAGFDVLSLANNHAADFGDEGRASTRKVLDELGIKHAGSDRQQFTTAIVEAKGKRVAFIGFAHNNLVPNVNDLTFAKQLVEQANKRADLVVVSFHGGAEGVGAQRVPKALEMFGTEKRGNLPLFARTVIDAGADLVLGHGPHVLRGMEIYKDRLIAYSMGNFATYGMFSLKAETSLTAIFEITIAPDGKFLSGKLHAGKQLGRGGPTLDAAGEAIRKVRELSIADFAGNAPKIADDGSFTK